MNQEEILNKIKEDMITAWYSYKRTDVYDDSRVKSFREAYAEFINDLKNDCMIRGYTVKIPKLPRKLKKYYKKHGIMPIDIVELPQIKCLDMTIQI